MEMMEHHENAEYQTEEEYLEAEFNLMMQKGMLSQSAANVKFYKGKLDGLNKKILDLNWDIHEKLQMERDVEGFREATEAVNFVDNLPVDMPYGIEEATSAAMNQLELMYDVGNGNIGVDQYAICTGINVVDGVLGYLNVGGPAIETVYEHGLGMVSEWVNSGGESINLYGDILDGE